jgi:Ca2+-binding EF-hand superfamily protein
MEPEAWFRTVDKDNDGKASQAEWIAKNKADAERNGKSVKEEVVVEKFKARDLDKDGFLSLQEFLSTRGK